MIGLWGHLFIKIKMLRRIVSWRKAIASPAAGRGRKIMTMRFCV